MRILAVVPSLYDTSPGQRFRMEQWAPLLEKDGIRVDFRAFECEGLNSVLYAPGRAVRKMKLISRAFFRRFGLMSSLSAYDAVYVFREAALLGPALFERLIRHSGIPMVFDFDDAVFVPYKSPSNGYLSLLKFPGKTRTICRLAAHVIAGNSYLAEYARRVTSRVTVVPTTIDTAKYTLDSSRRTSVPPVIGWSGSYSTVQHLETLRGALARLRKRHRFRLRVIGTARFEVEGVEVEATPWRSETEVEDLRSMDIGVMPLPDDPWSRGKCGLKALQYMALGIPTVCSPVGVNGEIVSDGRNGFLAATEDEWVDRLTLLLQSAPLRGRLGQAGRHTVEEKYSAAVQSPRVSAVFESVVREGSRTQPAPSLGFDSLIG